MGFLNPFKSNYTLIAENTTKYYVELTKNHKDRFSDEASLLATAGAITLKERPKCTKEY